MKLPHQQLAEDLMQAGLHEMSFAASEYRYHDFRSPLENPSITLAHELAAALKGLQLHESERKDRIIEIYQRHMRGEYDATKAESDDWAESEEGRGAFVELLRGGGRGDD